MNHYPFPLIKNISDVLPALEGHPEFIVAEREGYKVVNYMVAMEDSFPEPKIVGLTNGDEDSCFFLYETIEDTYAAIRRECRGLIFDSETGDIISRRYHKFFNIGQNEETQFDKIDLNLSHNILFKMDGSMISFIKLDGHWKATTKMGLTDVAAQVDEYIKNHPEYINLIEDHLEYNLTFIFEWCSRKQKIVIDYPKDQLILTAIRDTKTGQYKSYDVMDDIAIDFNIPCIQTYSSTSQSDLSKLMEEIKSNTEIEGVVIRYTDGHMLKLKADQYCLMHGAKDSLSFEKNVVKMVIEEKIDDVLPLLSDEDKVKLQKFNDDYYHQVWNTAFDLVDDFRRIIRRPKLSKKDFALGPATKMHPLVKSMMFTLFEKDFVDARDFVDLINLFILNNCGTQTKLNSVKFLFGDLKWNYFFEGDN